MVTKFSTIAIVVFSYMAMVSSTCRKDCTQTNYSFEMGVKAYPDSEIISVGDTLWIEISESVTLEDVFTGREVTYNGSDNLGTNIGFQEIIGSTPQINNAASFFSFKVLTGKDVNSSNPELYREYLFEESNNFYLFKLGVIPKRSGTFRLSLGSAANVYRDSDKCSKASVSYNFKNTNQHFYLFPGGSNTPPGGATYYFNVK